MNVLDRLSEKLIIPLSLVVPNKDGSLFSIATTPKYSPGFCCLLNKSIDGKKLCQADSIIGFEQCLKSTGPVVYQCHAGLFKVAVPIELEGNCVGAVIGGNFRFSDNIKPNSNIEKLRFLMQDLGVPKEKMLHSYNEVTVYSRECIEVLFKTLSQVSVLFLDTAIAPPHFSLTEAIENVKELTPELILYLKKRENALDKLPWDVFEHLIAEFFASWGFSYVKLVGRTDGTAADIFAIESPSPSGVVCRYFIEVKRWRNKVGIEVVDRVYGAFVREKPKWGWHIAMICSTADFKEFKSTDYRRLCLMGVELRGKTDVLNWLREYKLSGEGLWLPKHVALEPLSQGRKGGRG